MGAALIADLFPYLLVFVRILAFLSIAPLVSMQVVPLPTRVGFALLAAMGLASAFPPSVPVPAAGGEWIFYVAKEVLIGLAMGYLTSLVVQAAQMAGSLLSIQVGFSFGQYVSPNNPFTGGQMETLLNVLAGLLFFASDVHLLFFRALFDSFSLFPVWSLTPNVAQGVIPLIMGSVALSLRLALPLLVALLLAELVLMLSARIVPQMNAFMILLPGKVLLLFVLLYAALPVMGATLLGAYQTMAANLVKFAAGLGG